MTLGSNIRKLRMELGLTQIQLAQKAGVSQATVSDYENNEVSEHRAHVLFKIAAALGTTPEYLQTGKSPKRLSESPDDIKELLHVVENLGKDERAMILAAARSLLIKKSK